ncbi:MAG: GNAT family N-acetyltransferase [Planctomycetales bacterium]|nr:GNAT family N-acetyltransferase [Planctomycetales bacterium]
MMQVFITDFETHRGSIRAVRSKVFIEEQGVAPELEMDDRDEKCRHAIVFLAGQAVATGRLDIEKAGKVGRVAVLKEYRKQGLGTAVMGALEKVAQESDLSEIWFHAQESAVSFYLRLGYTIDSERFMEANIPHFRMSKKI